MNKIIFAGRGRFPTLHKYFLAPLVTSLSLLLLVPAAQAEGPRWGPGGPPIGIPGGVITPIQTNPLPDFYLLAVQNHHQSGPMGLFRFGSCWNDVRVVLKNLGAAYQYGDTLQAYPRSKPVTGGQILINLQVIKNGQVKSTKTHFLNALGAGEVKNLVFGGSSLGAHFPGVGNYTLKATVFGCRKGNSTGNCARFPEKNTNNNTFSVNYYVNHACN